MTTLKNKVIDAMRDNEWMTSNQISKLITDACAPEVSKILHYMVGMSFAESRPTKRGKRREFKLISVNCSIPRGTVRRFISENPGLTVEEISNGIPCRKATVNEYLRNAMRDERVTREKNENGQWAYTMNEENNLPFGMQNPTRFMFEELLKSARNNKQISCN